MVMCEAKEREEGREEGREKGRQRKNNFEVWTGMTDVPLLQEMIGVIVGSGKRGGVIC